ncbi:MAG TPA: ATP-binding cassette domain-containing protein, partial [Candidatus Nanoarchaeia archaeon]|nr:ATP-binding cassette domain-containing protein [Candidatus Nanoarchaeia archaeon]
MLDIKNLHSGYEDLEVLKGIDINVKPNEIIALIGPNGAGKTTVIKSVFNIAKISSGTITFKEKDITKLRTHELMELGISYVSQGRINFSNLTVEENLEIGCNLIHDKEVIEKNKELVYRKFPALHEKRKKLA